MQNYPLEAGGVDDYPVKVGSMLFTLVDPHRGYERAYNRWYERDHFYAGCLSGPHLLAGGRWVAPRELKDLRWPAAATAVADPPGAGSFLAVYFIERDHHDDFNAWAQPRVNELYRDGRGFAERSHVHTAMYDYLGAAYRDADPVPLELALDHRYAGLFCLWLDARDVDAYSLHQNLGERFLPNLLQDSPIEIAASWTPVKQEISESDIPMSLGSPAGGRKRLLQLLFVGGDVRETVQRVRGYTDALEKEKLATTRLAAPFFPTVVGTDTYIDRLW